jgi:hypothetical protein
MFNYTLLSTCHIRAVIQAINYSNIRIIKLTVTVRRILGLFKEFYVVLYLFDALS